MLDRRNVQLVGVDNLDDQVQSVLFVARSSGRSHMTRRDNWAATDSLRPRHVATTVGCLPIINNTLALRHCH